MKKHFSTSTFLFAAIFLFLIVILVSFFYAFATNQSFLSDHWLSAFFATKKDWSSLSDFLTFIFGIPTALAGSVVAILLAQKAYELSRSQSELESRNYIESSVKTVTDHYWSIGMAIHDMDRLLDPYILASATEATVINTYSELKSKKAAPADADKLIEEARNQRLKAEVDFWNSASSLGNSIRALYRDRIALAIWEIGAKTTDEKISKLALENTGLLLSFKKSRKEIPRTSSAMDIAQISSYFFQPISFRHRDTTPAWLLSAFISQHTILADIQRYKTENDHADKRVVQNQVTENRSAASSSEDDFDFENIIWEPSPHAIIERFWQNIDPYIASSEIRRPDIRFKTLSSIISYKPFMEDGLSKIYLDGMLVLSTIILTFPNKNLNEDRLEEIFFEIGLERNMIRRAISQLKKHNIPDYIPSWLRQCAEDSMRHCDVTAYFSEEIRGYSKIK